MGSPEDQRATIRSLGLRRLSHTVEHPDSPSVRGMVEKVRHLVRVEEVREEPSRDMAPAKRVRRARATPAAKAPVEGNSPTRQGEAEAISG
ncbi:MAG: 50S ribosomal protein L30 [Chloroflexi bacterium]|nr:50S ribosomal protein L30 [Chloroflexota bacterium]